MVYNEDMHAVRPIDRFTKLIRDRVEETVCNVPVILREIAELKEYNRNPGINFTVTPAARLRLIVEAPDRNVDPLSLFVYAEGHENIKTLKELRYALEKHGLPSVYTLDRITKRISKNPLYEWYLSTSIKHCESPIKGLCLSKEGLNARNILRRHSTRSPPLETWYRR
jgi:hypothetical protein